jgi:hypothetical protein
LTLCLLVNFWMGKDMNADFLAYHIYSAHMYWTGQYTADFMGAGLQGFFNPLGYVPIYLMLQQGLSPLAASSVMAAMHSINLVLIWLIARQHVFGASKYRETYSILATLMAGLSPVFIATLGGSFLEPLLAVPLLAGIYCILQSKTSNQPYLYLALAGAMMGFAAGLKPTVVTIPAISGLVLVLTSECLRSALSRTAIFTASAALAAIVSGGAWAWHLWKMYGNPVFPFANNVFKSPDFAAVALKTDRFIPDTILEALAFPFRMAKVNSGTYVEIAAPDIRFALLCIAGAVLLALAAWRAGVQGQRQDRINASTPVGILWLIFLPGCVLWMGWLGNGRYHLVYLLLVGILVPWMILRLCNDRLIGVLASALIVVLQFVHGNSAGYPRWEAGNWTDQWVKASVPPRLAVAPATYLLVGPGIDTAIIPALPLGTHFVDLAGKFPISPTSPESRRIHQMIRGKPTTLMAVVKAKASPPNQWMHDRIPSAEAMAQIDHLLAPWDLSLSGAPCATIEIELDREEINTPAGRTALMGARQYGLMVCPVKAGAQEDMETQQTRLQLTVFAEKISRACPVLFPEPYSFPVRFGRAWNISFVASDTMLNAVNGEITYSRFPYGPFNVSLGDITQSPETSLVCKKQRMAW